MLPRQLLASLGLALAMAAPACATEHERNFWPAWVAPVDATGKSPEWEAAGPLFFRKLLPEGRVAVGFRPVYLKKTDPAEHKSETSLFYPIFVYRTDGTEYRWSVFSLINRQGPEATVLGPGDASDRGLDIWPVYFSRETNSADTSYHAVFPIFGTVKNRFYVDRSTWVLFPLFLHTQSKGAIVNSMPWPFIRVISADGNSGFALWPLFGWRKKPGFYHREFLLWPLLYRNVSHLDEPVPTEGHGFLPFYTHESSPGVVSENYLWPFFGYTDRTAPYRYHETRYLWPFFVQGRGDDHYRNRWGPFYTHSIMKGVDKQWYAWPLYRREQWTDAGLIQTKTQFFYFIYWSLQQRSATNPALASAQKTHVWPLYSYWNNGAGRRQFQLFSPIDVFLDNENTHLLWSPLFAIYRYDQSPGTEQQSFLFHFITWERTPEHTEFHLGPFFKSEHSTGTSRVTLAGGLVNFRHTDSGWRSFWFDFSQKTAKTVQPRLAARSSP